MIKKYWLDLGMCRLASHPTGRSTNTDPIWGCVGFTGCNN